MNLHFTNITVILYSEEKSCPVKPRRTTALNGQFNAGVPGSEQAGCCPYARNPGLSQQQQRKVPAAERSEERSGRGGHRHQGESERFLLLGETLGPTRSPVTATPLRYHSPGISPLLRDACEASVGNAEKRSPGWTLSPSPVYARLGLPPFLPLRLFRMHFIIFIPCRDETWCVRVCVCVCV